MIPVVELFVKASYFDKEDFGSCPVNQTWFMAFYLLVENKIIDLKVTPINIEIPSDTYISLNVSRRLPVAKVESGTDLQGHDISHYVAGTTDELERLVSIWNCPELKMGSEDSKVASAEKQSADILKSLNILFINKNDKQLLSTLTKINDYLESRDHKYMISDKVTFPDCVLMPRLQHVRVAGKEFAGFDIPQNLTRLKQYISDMYKENVFEISCPKNRDIFAQHEDKVQIVRSRKSMLAKDDTKLFCFDTE